MIHINEKHMLDSFIEHRNSFFYKVTNEKTRKKFVITEFNSSFGVADAVIGTYFPHVSKWQARKPVDATWVKAIIDGYAEPGLDIYNLAKAHSTTISTVKKKMQQFLDAEILYAQDKGIYTVKTPYRVIIKTSVAIEAKIRDWNKALSQARRYRKFANYSFVLLDEDHVSPAINGITKFHKHGIGLASMGKRSVTIHYQPERQTPQADLYLYKLNEQAYEYLKKCHASS